MLFGTLRVDVSLHAALTKKRKIFECSAVFWCAVRLCTPYTSGVIREGKEERKKKKERRNSRKSKFSRTIFSTVKRSNGNSRDYIIHTNS